MMCMDLFQFYINQKKFYYGISYQLNCFFKGQYRSAQLVHCNVNARQRIAARTKKVYQLISIALLTSKKAVSVVSHAFGIAITSYYNYIKLIQTSLSAYKCLKQRVSAYILHGVSY